jgi:hypothetical protein
LKVELRAGCGLFRRTIGLGHPKALSAD